MRRYHKIIIESYNPKGDSLVIGNLPSNDMVHYYGELRALSESYGMNVSLKDSNIHIMPSSLSNRGMLEGINKFMDDHAYDPTFAKGSETVVYTKSKALIESEDQIPPATETIKAIFYNNEAAKIVCDSKNSDITNALDRIFKSLDDVSPVTRKETDTGTEYTFDYTGSPKKDDDKLIAELKKLENNGAKLFIEYPDDNTSETDEHNDQFKNKTIKVIADDDNNTLTFICNNNDYAIKDALNGIFKSLPVDIWHGEENKETNESVYTFSYGISSREDVGKLEEKLNELKAKGVTIEEITHPSNDVEAPPVGTTSGEQAEQTENPAVTKLKATYKNLFSSIPLMTASDDDAKKLENYIVKLLTSDKIDPKTNKPIGKLWSDHINEKTNKGKNIVAIRKTILPYFAENINIQLADVNANGTINGDDSASNIQGSGFIVPKRYSKDMKPPVLDSKQLVITKFGFPMLNCETKTMQILMSDSYDKATKKPLLKEFIKKIKNTDLAEAIGGHHWGWGVLDRIMEMKKVQGLLPMVHKNMKVTNVDKIIAGTEGETVECIPVEDSNDKFESTDMHGNPLLEFSNPFTAIKHLIAGGKNKDKDIPSSFGDSIVLKSDYLAQFYELADFTDPEGEALYLRYTSKADMEQMREAIGDDKDGKEPISKKEMWNRYLAKTKGRPLFYVMQEKTKFLEGIRVSPKPYLRNLYLVKTIVKVGGSKGNRAIYFLTEKQKNEYFTLG